MKHIFQHIKYNKEFYIGIVSFILFIGIMAGFVFLFRDENIEMKEDAEQSATPIPTTTSVPTLALTDTPTPTLTSTPTFTPTVTPTFTPTPTYTVTPTPILLTEKQLRLKEQYEAKAEEYALLKETSEKQFTFPVINIVTLDGEKFKVKEKVEVNNVVKNVDNWVTSYVEVFNCEERYKLSKNATVRVRGNSTAKTAPFPLRIKFDEKQGMLGLNKGNDFKNWVLLKPGTRVISDYLAFKIGHTIYDGKYYISDCTPVNVYINGDYYGLYMLAEQNQVKKKRVNVNEPSEGYAGVDVGYFLEIDNYAGRDLDSDPCIKVPYTINRKTVRVKDFEGKEGEFVVYTKYTVHSDIYSDEQIKYIEKYINGAFEIIYLAVEENKFCTFDEKLNVVDASDRFKNAEETITDLMDIDSVVETYLIEEIMGNYDRGNGSFYMAVDFSKKAKYDKLTFLAPWDFNWCVFGEQFVAGTFYGILNGKYKENVHPWFILLMKEDWFRQKVAKRWDELYSTHMLNDVLDDTRVMLDGAKGDFDHFGKNQYSIAVGTISNVDDRMKFLNEQMMKWLSE